MPQEVSQESSCVRIFLGEELALCTSVIAEGALRLEKLDVIPCSVPVDEVDKVDMDPANGLVSPVRDAKIKGTNVLASRQASKSSGIGYMSTI